MAAERDERDGSVGPTWSTPGELASRPGPPRDGAPVLPAAHPFEVDEKARYAGGHLLGRGGMGRVTAVMDQRLRRDVALKEAVGDAPGADVTPRLASRLGQEAWITAQLEHPGIVPIYDAGVRDGHPYYTMRLIRGRSLSAAAAGQPPEARLRLVRHFHQVCEAVAFAHSRGIVHRDLKPDNVMIGEFGETQVVDWGLARPVGTVDGGWERVVPAAHAAHTQLGSAVGTPAYMSPEQRALAPADPRSDVWSLGVSLHELLYGALPGGATSRDSAVPVELDAIIRKTLAEDPEGRYPTAGELAADIEAWLDGRRVGAYHYRPTDQLGRFVRRFRVPLIVGAASLLLLIVGGALSWFQVARERDLATLAAAETRGALERADAALHDALVVQAGRALDDMDWPTADQLVARAFTVGDSVRARGVAMLVDAVARPSRSLTWPLPEGCLFPVSVPVGGAARGPGGVLCLGPDVSLWRPGHDAPEWTVARDASRAVVLEGLGAVAVASPGGDAALIALSTGAETPVPARLRPTEPWIDADHLLIAPIGESVLAWSPRDGRVREHPICPGRSRAWTFAMSPDDESLMAFCDDGTIEIGSPFGALRAGPNLPAGPAPPRAVRILPGASELVVSDTSGTVRRVALDTGLVRWSTLTPLGSVAHLAFAGGWLIAAGDRGGALVLNLETGATLMRLPGEPVSLRIGGASVDIVTSGALSHIGLPAAMVPPRGPSGPGLAAASPSPDGRYVAAARSDGRVIVTEVDTGRVVVSQVSGDGVTKRAEWHPAGDRLVVANASEATLDVIAVPSGETVFEPRAMNARRAVFFDDGGIVAVTYASGLWFSAPGVDTLTVSGPEYTFTDLTTNPTGTHGAALTLDGHVHRLVTGQRRLDSPPAFTATGAQGLAIDAAGQRLALSFGSSVRVASLDGAIQAEVTPPRGVATDTAFDLSGRWLAVGMMDGRVVVAEASSGQVRAELRPHDQRVATVRFGVRGLLTASWDGTYRWSALGPLTATPAALTLGAETAWGSLAD